MPPETQTQSQSDDAALAALFAKVETSYTFDEPNAEGRSAATSDEAKATTQDAQDPSDATAADQVDDTDDSTSAADPGASSDDGDDASGDDNANDEETDEDDGDDASGDEPTPTDSAAAEKAKAYQLPKALEAVVASVPAEQQDALRSAIGTRLGEMQAGMTRAQQEAATLRREVAAAKARETARSADPVTAILAQFEADPTLVDKVADALDAVETNPAEKGKAKQKLADAEQAAVKAVDDEAAEQSARLERADAVERLGRQLAAQAGVPFSLGVEQAIAAHIWQHGDIGDDDVRGIVKRIAKDYVGHVAAKTRETLKKERLAKQADRAKARPSMPASATPPAPGKAKPARELTLEEKMMGTAARMFPGAK